MIEVLDRRVLFVPTEDIFGLFLPIREDQIWSMNTCIYRYSLIGSVDIFNRNDGQVSVISRIS